MFLYNLPKGLHVQGSAACHSFYLTIMATPRLSGLLLEELTTLVQEGRTPKDLAAHFGVAVSTIHNYKRLLKEQKIAVPCVRGRHSGYCLMPPTAPVLMLGTFHGFSEDMVTLPGEEGQAQTPGYMTISIAGQTIQVDKRASSVRVDADGTVHAIL